ncbi:hypothetical protein FEM03_06430 [Phragmitibacter flavus]|uniref:Glutathionylspermidine synthase family protein n=1 Tax=Phragmitibacter flavus TaxID=2576071 RepID=A0A5R8KHR0_9BACT|nr:hypothetical protein [Phragmitibacter flavus]TLD71770.1 hypothetical protein FEM03_06430 [Phragmitibacter flavus]
MPTPSYDAQQRITAIRNAMPEGGMFEGKEWVTSPEAFPIQPELLQKIEDLGDATLAFQRACNDLYLDGTDGGTHAWVTQLLDQGKPASLIKLGRDPLWRNALPRVIRPDLILSETGVSIAELDSLPGGIGLTGWLGQTYTDLGEENIIGGPDGMIEGFSRAFPGHDFLISRESIGYQPEMAWLAEQLNQLEGSERRVLNPWEIEPHEVAGADLYRFFELWDLDHVEHSPALLQMARSGELHFTPPLKPYLEEKLWLALFWSPALRDWWSTHLTPAHLTLLQECIPYGWVFDPVQLPLHAEWPQLGIQSWNELKKFGNKERELVLKISGFAETAWGSRGVSIGHDLSGTEWSAAIDDALARFPQTPHVLQRFTRARVIAHPMWNDATNQPANLQGRVRLCPYYFVSPDQQSTSLGGILATAVPADKKILHGMRDAVIVPCKTA